MLQFFFLCQFWERANFGGTFLLLPIILYSGNYVYSSLELIGCQTQTKAHQLADSIFYVPLPYQTLLCIREFRGFFLKQWTAQFRGQTSLGPLENTLEMAK